MYTPDSIAACDPVTSNHACDNRAVTVVHVTTVHVTTVHVTIVHVTAVHVTTNLYCKPGDNGDEVGCDGDGGICIASQHLVQDMAQVQGAVLSPYLPCRPQQCHALTGPKPT